MTTALRATAVFLAVMLLLSSCASLKNSNTDQRLLIIRIAKNMINKQYKYGKQDPSWGFDCSGLTQYAYREAGIKIPRTSQNQYNDCRKISLSEIKPADLLFFSTNGSGASHVGIYIGNNK